MSDPSKIPGVYISELNAFPGVEGVATAIPIFIGYTEKAVDPASGNAVYLSPISVASMADYEAYFGQSFVPQFAVKQCQPLQAEFNTPISDTAIGYFQVDAAGNARFNLYQAMQLFYANGGGPCYVVSVANYQGGRAADSSNSAVPIDKDLLLKGVEAAGCQSGPTMLVVPDACLLASAADYGDVTVAQLAQAGALQDRCAILDLHGALDPASWTKPALAAQRDAFYACLATAAPSYSYGAAYAPALRTSVLGPDGIDFTFLQPDPAASAIVKTLLLRQSANLYGADSAKKAQVEAKIEEAFPETPSSPPPSPQHVKALDRFLTNALPLLLQIEKLALDKLNVAPPSGIMAGIWTQNDAVRGVWNAPANISCASVVTPLVEIDGADQEEYNIPANGLAINILRDFTGRGTVVWGSRTLDGNSNNFRYVQVRRTLIYIEISIKTALQQFVFAPNNANTWVTVTAMISNFLTGLWQQGGLMGDKASDAFTVRCGIGSTMTGQDILNGYMIVNATVQMTHPAEFIELTFTQTMQSAPDQPPGSPKR